MKYSAVIIVLTSVLLLVASAPTVVAQESNSSSGDIPNVTLISNNTEDTTASDGNKTSENRTNISSTKTDSTTTDSTTTDSTTNTNLTTNNTAANNSTTDNATTTGSREGIVCKSGSAGSSTRTVFGSVLQNFLTVVVVLSGLFAILNGTFYTTASAIRPSKEEYAKRRNLSLLYGLATIIVLYGVIAALSQVDSALEFSCLSPSF